MEKDVSPAKSGTIFGVLFGVIMILEFVIMYVIGMKSLANSSIKTFVDISNYLILPLLFIYLGCSNYKNKINYGYISLTECLTIRVSISVIAAIIYASFNIVFNLLFPEFIDEIISISKEEMLKKPNITNEQLEMGLAVVKKMMSPYFLFPITLAMYSFFGLIYSLIIGAFIKKEKP